MVDGGVLLAPHVAVAEVVELAQHAERLGYGRVWLADEGLHSRDVLVTMTAVALATETVSIGTGIVNPYTRHPGLTAAAIATIDELCGGRAFAGVGAGGSLSLAPLAISRERPLLRVREAIGALREHGGDVEVWFAGRGPKMLRQAGALADGVLLEFLYKPALGDYAAQVRQGAAETGNEPLLCYSTIVLPDRSQYDAVRPHMTYRLVDSQPEVRDALGMTDGDVAAIRATMAMSLAEAGKLIRNDWIDPFVIVGSPAQCAAEINELSSTHGFREFALVVPDMGNAVGVMNHCAEALALTAGR